MKIKCPIFLTHGLFVLDTTTDRISLQNIFPRKFLTLLSHVSVTVTLETSIAPDGLYHNFLPRNRQNNFFLLMWDNFFASLYYGQSFAISFWGNSGPISGWKVSFFDHCTLWVLICMFIVNHQNTPLWCFHALCTTCVFVVKFWSGSKPVDKKCCFVHVLCVIRQKLKNVGGDPYLSWTQVTLVHHGTQCRLLVHNIVLYQRSNAQTQMQRSTDRQMGLRMMTTANVGHKNIVMHNNKMGYANIFSLATMSFRDICNDNPFYYYASRSRWNKGINVGQ